MQGQPEDKATAAKLRKTLPLTAVSLSQILLLIDSLLPALHSSEGRGGKAARICGSVKNSPSTGQGWTNSTCCTSLSCRDNQQSPCDTSGSGTAPSQAARSERVRVQGAQVKCVPPEGVSGRHTLVLHGAPIPSPHSSAGGHSQHLENWLNLHTQSLQVQAHGQCHGKLSTSPCNHSLPSVFQLLKQRHRWSELGLVLCLLKIFISFSVLWISEIYPQCLLSISAVLFT